MKGHWIEYTDRQLAWLKANRKMTIREYHAAFCKRFLRHDVSAVNLNALRKRMGWKTGRTGCFVKGAEPHNKGKVCAEGTGGRHPNARKTQFRKGSLNGRAAQRYQPIGTERFSKDGYLERKVHDGLPPQSRWQTVQRINWEAANGPLPKGHALKCLDGNKLNTHPTNWEAVPRAMLPILNGGRFKTRLAYDEAPAELKPTVMAIAKLVRQVGEVTA